MTVNIKLQTTQLQWGIGKEEKERERERERDVGMVMLSGDPF